MKRAGFLLLFCWVAIPCSSLLAQDANPYADEEAAAENARASSHVASEPSDPGSETEQEVIQPLDPWYHFKGIQNPTVPRKPKPKQEEKIEPAAAVAVDDQSDEDKLEPENEVAKADDSESEPEVIEQQIIFGDEEDVDFYEDVDSEYVEEQEVSAKTRTITLTIDQTARIRALQKRYLKNVAKAQRLQRAYTVFDPRGPADYKICTLNLNNYGLLKEVERVLHKRGVRAQKRKEKSFAKTIANLKCDLVAVQGVLGKTVDDGRSGLRILGGKIQALLGGNWEAFVGPSNHKLNYNGFLVNLARATVIGTTTHTDKFLPRFGIFEESNFVRAPYEIILEVDGQDGAETKQLIVTNFHFQRSINLGKPEPESMKMQMAEAVRQIVEVSRLKLSGSKSTISMAVGDRVSGLDMPSTLILEGRLKLTDFKSGDVCKLPITNKHHCDPFPQRGKTLFGLVADSIEPVAITRTNGKKSPDVGKNANAMSAAKRRIERTDDIYMFQNDLALANKDYNFPGVYAVGGVQVDNKMPNSPLLWAELNW